MQPERSIVTCDWLVVAAALSAITAILAGAFAAHAMTGKPVEWLHTGMQYQLAHSTVTMGLSRNPMWRRCAWIMIAGAAVFSGSLYVMALGAPLWFGAITPVGGVLMVCGWLCLAVKEVSHRA